jgi:zinc/manganese transport system substrate-binding protein
MNRRIFLGLTTALAILPLGAFAQDKLPVVATFSILGDMVATVGGDRVSVTTLVGPDGDAHVYEPSPADAQAVAAAKVVFTNGFHFEGWMDRLLQAAEYKGPIVVGTTGLTPNRFVEEGVATDQDDPHAWQSLKNGHQYVVNITAGLIAADPAGEATYTANSEAYLAQIDAMDAEVKAAMDAIPAANRVIVTSHDAFGYFGQEYGLKLLAPEGISTETEASAADVAKLITQINAEKIPAVFMENITNPRLLEQITAETTAKVGGTLFSDALSPPDGEGATYLDMMRHNIATLTAALGS